MNAPAYPSVSPDATALGALDEAGRAIAGVLALEDVLQLIVDRVRNLVGQERCVARDYLMPQVTQERSC